MRVLRALTISALLGAAAFAQGFPWEIFRPRTLKEVIATTTKSVRDKDSMFLAQNQLESKVEVVFTGKSRPLPETRKNFIFIWFEMLRSEQKEMAALYESEYLYKEGEAEHWLPTAKPVTKYFDKELKPGDEIDLYLISIGAYRSERNIDCVLLVEEFQKKAAPKTAHARPRVSVPLVEDSRGPAVE